jgi:RNA polymerase sigma factor (sigma-70 family)
VKRRPVRRRGVPAPLPVSGSDPSKARHVRDAHLVARCLEGDGEAWSELLTRHRPLVMTIARRHGLRGEDAEDLYQSTCVTMLERLDLLRDHQTLAAWLATTATRKCWRMRRRLRGDAALPDDLADEAPSPERAFAEAARTQAVREALADLGDPCAKLLRGLFSEDAPYDEVARSLGLAVGSIGVYRRRCLDRLRARLEAAGWPLSRLEGEGT